MNDKLNSALGEIDELLIEEAAQADRAERGGLRIARNIGLSVCGAAAAAAALTFGVSRHMATRPENVDLLPAESGEAQTDISDVIAENTLKTISVERVDIADVDPARLADSSPYFIEAGNAWKMFDDDGNMLSDGNTIVVMDVNGYWLEYDITETDGEIYELLDVRAALGKAEEVLGASLLPGNSGIAMGSYNLGGNDYSYTVTAFFDDKSCLNYRLKCDTNHENWTLTLISDEPAYLADKTHSTAFFREKRENVYDSARFGDGYGCYICDNNGDIRVVKHTENGYFGYLPFGGSEYIYTLELTDSGRRQKYCVKENGNAYVTSEDFLVTGGSEHQDDPLNILVPPSVNIVDGMGSGDRKAIGASKVYEMAFFPAYDGLALRFMEDMDGKLFLNDGTRLYPCKLMEVDDGIGYYMTIDYFENSEVPDGYITYMTRILMDDNVITLANNCDVYIEVQGELQKITLPKGTEFVADGGSADPDSIDVSTTSTFPHELEAKIRAKQEENAAESYPAEGLEYPVDAEFKHGTYYRYDEECGMQMPSLYFTGSGIGGAEVRAAQSGTVLIYGWDAGYYDNFVVIDHGSGLSTLYSHLTDITVTEGQSVSRGDVIGHVRDTGFSTEDVLGFEVRIDGIPVSFEAYVNGSLGGAPDDETLTFLPIRNKSFDMERPDGYDGPDLQFYTDDRGCLFLTDDTWTYPCEVTELREDCYEIYAYFWPEGRELPLGGVTNSSTAALITGDTLTLDMDTAMNVVHNGADAEIVLPKGTVFRANDNAPAGLSPEEMNELWEKLIASVPDPDFVYPAAGDYAIVEHMYGHKTESGYYRHGGIDIGIGLGAPVLAAADGEVILAEWYSGYGNCVMVEHANGVVTVYGHCDELYVSEGETVTRGQTIAGAGKTGLTTSACLHFEVRIDDEQVDPALFGYRISLNGELSEPTRFE